jgi:hypothetical protein
MRNDFYSKSPVGEDLWGSIAQKRSVDTPRNNLLLQLGRVETQAKPRDEVAKDYVAFDTFWKHD